jgi:hypothetical protein
MTPTPAPPADKPAPDPRARFASPELLMASADLSDSEKCELLREWKIDLDNRLLAEDEGMSASDPLRAERGARMADEAARVTTLLATLEEARAGRQ